MAESILRFVRLVLANNPLPRCFKCGTSVLNVGVSHSSNMDAINVYAQCHGMTEVFQLDGRTCQALRYDATPMRTIERALKEHRWFVKIGEAGWFADELQKAKAESEKVFDLQFCDPTPPGVRANCGSPIQTEPIQPEPDRTRGTKGAELRALAVELRTFAKRFTEAKYDDERLLIAAELLKMAPGRDRSEHIAAELIRIAGGLDWERR